MCLEGSRQRSEKFDETYQACQVSIPGHSGRLFDLGNNVVGCSKSQATGRTTSRRQGTLCVHATKRKLTEAEVQQRRAGRPAVNPLELPTNPHESLIRLDNLSVTTQGTQVGVVASTTMHNVPNHSLYMWGLMVRDEDTKDILINEIYENQGFSTIPRKTINPVFFEEISLGPGNYFVQIRLYNVSPDMDLEKLKTKKMPQANISLTGYKKISIEPG